jgi:hypothetical protein
MARMATFNELTFSTLLFLGLATRLVTLPFLGNIRRDSNLRVSERLD